MVVEHHEAANPRLDAERVARAVTYPLRVQLWEGSPALRLVSWPPRPMDSWWRSSLLTQRCGPVAHPVSPGERQLAASTFNIVEEEQRRQLTSHLDTAISVQLVAVPLLVRAQLQVLTMRMGHHGDRIHAPDNVRCAWAPPVSLKSA
eukprot:CAMPEP_0194532492 /NCGR_PEP_ID=MMETSP0253-20130528/70075_1 /TAXON_ID=2966 /ORGANISM="Noctiluca scintillans" /LENGTH=146 /DNA_ID=CAMNT_0039377945 /DNA_START=191 /DNA_END=631 /DNA_ORIENTATION=+